MAEPVSSSSASAELYSPPAGLNTKGLIAVVYGVDALRAPWGSMIQGYAESLAAKGFLALIPKYLGPAPPSREAVAEMIAFRRDEWQAAILEEIEKAKVGAGVAGIPVGLLGFSLGGHLCLRLRSEASVLVECFAPLLPQFGDLGNAGGLTHAQIHHGKADGLVDYDENAPKIEQLLRDEGAVVELCSYDGASHGFAKPHAKDTEARTLSKDRTIAFFEAHLR